MVGLILLRGCYQLSSHGTQSEQNSQVLRSGVGAFVHVSLAFLSARQSSSESTNFADMLFGISVGAVFVKLLLATLSQSPIIEIAMSKSPTIGTTSVTCVEASLLFK